MRATFVKLHWENQSHTIASFLFQPASRYRYEAGQYAVLSVNHDAPDSRGIERTMTLSSSPDEPLLKFTMRIYSGQNAGSSGSSFKRALLALQPGNPVTIYDAMGDLVLPLDASIPLVFIAGGVGIASFTGIIQTLLKDQDNRQVSLFYTVARPDDIVMQQPFDDYAALGGLTKHLSVRPDRLTAADILPAVKPDSLVYLSGTESMVEQLRASLIAAGVSSQQIIFDYFDGYSEL